MEIIYNLSHTFSPEKKYYKFYSKYILYIASVYNFDNFIMNSFKLKIHTFNIIYEIKIDERNL